MMPNGLALYHLDHSVGRQQRILQRIAPAPGGSGLAEAALSAVQDWRPRPATRSPAHPRAPAAEQRGSGLLRIAGERGRGAAHRARVGPQPVAGTAGVRTPTGVERLTRE